MIETPAPLRQLFILSAVLTKQDGGRTSVASTLSYRVATDGEDAVVGRYVQQVMGENPGFSLCGKASVMEIPREDIEQALVEVAP